ncbi:nanos homolog 3 isoform 2-T2 [Morphnus guianensis]
MGGAASAGAARPWPLTKLLPAGSGSGFAPGQGGRAAPGCEGASEGPGGAAPVLGGKSPVSIILLAQPGAVAPSLRLWGSGQAVTLTARRSSGDCSTLPGSVCRIAPAKPLVPLPSEDEMPGRRTPPRPVFPVPLPSW